jgi:hypothetical protein
MNKNRSDSLYRVSDSAVRGAVVSSASPGEAGPGLTRVRPDVNSYWPSTCTLQQYACHYCREEVIRNA